MEQMISRRATGRPFPLRLLAVLRPHHLRPRRAAVEEEAAVAEAEVEVTEVAAVAAAAVDQAMETVEEVAAAEAAHAVPDRVRVQDRGLLMNRLHLRHPRRHPRRRLLLQTGAASVH